MEIVVEKGVEKTMQSKTFIGSIADCELLIILKKIQFGLLPMTNVTI